MSMRMHESEPVHLEHEQSEFSAVYACLQVEIDQLPPEEAALLRLLFGPHQRPRTLNEAAAALGLTPTEAERVQARALQKLRWLSLRTKCENDWDEV